LKQYSEKLVATYRQIYREERLSGSPDNAYSQEVSRRLSSLTQEFGISVEMPHAAYRNLLPVYGDYVVIDISGTIYPS
jgi:hypothetical protein